MPDQLKQCKVHSNGKGDKQKCIEVPNFHVAVYHQEITLVNEDTGEEFQLIKQQSQCDLDGFFSPWLTHKLKPDPKRPDVSYVKHI